MRFSSFFPSGSVHIVRTTVKAFLMTIFSLSGILLSGYCYKDSLSFKYAMAAESAVPVRTPEQMASQIKPLAKLMAQNCPNIEEAKKILGYERYNQRDNQTIINRHDYRTRIIMTCNNSDCIKVLSFYYDFNFGLRMKHIINALGKIRTERHHPAKAYFSRFGYYNPDNKTLSYIIVSTLTVPTDPEAPVTSITIRRDEKPPQEILNRITPLIMDNGR